MKSSKYILSVVAIVFLGHSCHHKKQEDTLKVNDPKAVVEKVFVGNDTVAVYYEMDENQAKLSSKQKQIAERIISRVRNEWRDSIDNSLFRYYVKNHQKIIKGYVWETRSTDSVQIQGLFPKPTSIKKIVSKYKLHAIVIPSDSKYRGVHFRLLYVYSGFPGKKTIVEFDGWEIVNVYS